MAYRITEVRLKAIATEMGLSADDVARMSDVNFNTVMNLWRNAVTNPTLETAIPIARALNVPVEQLVIGEYAKERRGDAAKG